MQAPELVGPIQSLAHGYLIRLPFPMARRVEDGSLVFWHTPQGLTFWINVFERGTTADPLVDWQQMRSAAAEDERIVREDDLLRYCYRLNESGDSTRQPAFYGFVAQGEIEFQLAAYFNRAEMIEAVLETWRSISAGE